MYIPDQNVAHSKQTEIFSTLFFSIDNIHQYFLIYQMVGLSWLEVDTMNKNMTMERNITFSFTRDNKVTTYLECIKSESLTYENHEKKTKMSRYF